jgi:hypothetical protein
MRVEASETDSPDDAERNVTAVHDALEAAYSLETVPPKHSDQPSGSTPI